MKIKKLKIKKQGYFLIGGIISTVIIGGYLVLCLIAGGKDFLSNATINGIDVGKMTYQEAVDAISQKYQEDLSEPLITLAIDEQNYSINLQDNLSFNINDAVTNISKKSDSFFTRGYNYLFNHDYIVGIKVKDKDILTNKINESKILEYSTLIPTSYEIKDNSITFTKGKSGKTAELKSVIKTIEQALNKYAFKDTIKYSPIEHKIDEKEMKDLHKTLAVETKNATLDRNNNYAIVDGQVGAKFDLDDAIKKFNQTSEGKQFSLDASIVQPKITKEMLEQIGRAHV